MKFYRVLHNQIFSKDEFSIVPLRYEDRMCILKWRNEQIYHLRQDKPLTEEDQEMYFNTVVNKLFDEEQPDQMLFSYLDNDICIGYGGLVHINWIDKNAEISFIMDTILENKNFSMHWSLFLGLIEQVAFKELNFNKIFTFAFDLRPHLYEPIENAGFVKEAVLKKHCFFNEDFRDVVIHSKINSNE
jgi:RimJ/RimL family protein N-acetyltransferase